MKALLIVDVQNDFCPGGALPAPKGDKIIPVINGLMEKFSLIAASRDYHPVDSKHFQNWPKHCVAGTKGAEYHPMLDDHKIDKEFLKGTNIEDEGYSSFEATNDDLNGYLKSNNVTDLYISGLTTEYCVKETALTAVKNGYKTYLITDAVEGVRQNEGDVEKALQEMKETGVRLLTSEDV